MSFYLSFPHLPHVLQNVIQCVELLSGVGWSGVLRYEDKLLYSWRYSIDGEWEEAGKSVYRPYHHHVFIMFDVTQRSTCLWGFEADDKRLSGESIHISWSIIRVLILASDGRCVSPAHRHSAT